MDYWSFDSSLTGGQQFLRKVIERNIVFSSKHHTDSLALSLRWITELKEVLLALQELMQAQRQLFTAEWQLARSIATAAFLCIVLAIFFVLALSLSVTMLTALLLAKWFGSWILALTILVIILAFCLILALYGLRYCLHRISLPETRAQLHRTITGLVSTSTHDKTTNDRTLQKSE
ncbi:hypothetical protein Nstercoris_00947 [Nitrosomonas stercoris]|uniref:Phage holin family protein n=1 Tax=Nitrosomonas stercoris TaxID=1444684 RepID=A0A4Y1YRI1_9PROT|nr:hypothetical protein Nstercoris_00947 [Nitrosomonas stercoris]